MLTFNKIERAKESREAKEVLTGCGLWITNVHFRRKSDVERWQKERAVYSNTARCVGQHSVPYPKTRLEAWQHTPASGRSGCNDFSGQMHQIFKFRMFCLIPPAPAQIEEPTFIVRSETEEWRRKIDLGTNLLRSFRRERHG